MVPGWCRLLVAFATAFAVWALAAPARAAAPLCDPRGATVMAPAPSLEEPETSIDVGSPADDCLIRFALSAATGGRAPEAPSTTSMQGDPAVPGAGVILPAAPSANVIPAPVAPGGERPGARGRIDRPPRA